MFRYGYWKKIVKLLTVNGQLLLCIRVGNQRSNDHSRWYCEWGI